MLFKKLHRLKRQGPILELISTQASGRVESRCLDRTPRFENGGTRRDLCESGDGLALVKSGHNERGRRRQLLYDFRTDLFDPAIELKLELLVLQFLQQGKQIADRLPKQQEEDENSNWPRE
jgi:hypothetical protein